MECQLNNVTILFKFFITINSTFISISTFIYGKVKNLSDALNYLYRLFNIK